MWHLAKTIWVVMSCVHMFRFHMFSGLFLYCVAKDFEAMSADADLHSDVDDGSSCLSSSSSSGMGLSVKGFLEEVVSQVKSDSRCLIGFLLV